MFKEKLFIVLNPAMDLHKFVKMNNFCATYLGTTSKHYLLANNPDVKFLA